MHTNFQRIWSSLKKCFFSQNTNSRSSHKNINNCVKNPNYLIIIPQIKGKQIEELAYKGYNIYGINCDYYTGKINHLPNSLKILNLYNYVDDWKLKIPDSVEFIDYGYSKDSIDKYPKNIGYFEKRRPLMIIFVFCGIDQKIS